MIRKMFSLGSLGFLAGVFQMAEADAGGNAASQAGEIATGDDPTKPAEIVVPAGCEAFKYNFKTEPIKDAEGKKIGDGRKHPSVLGVFPVPQPADLITLLAAEAPKPLADGKGFEAPSAEFLQRELILAGVYELIKAAGKRQILDYLDKTPDGVFTTGMFDLSKLSLEWIALNPKERASSVPTDEEIAAFLEDYANVMVHAVGHEPKRVKMHVDLLKSKFAKCRTDKPVLAKLAEFLTIWGAKTSAMEEHVDVFQYLTERADKLVKAEPPKPVATVDAL